MTDLKEQTLNALNKKMPAMSDDEISIILTVPEAFWETNPFKYTPKRLIEEQNRRRLAAQIKFEDLLPEVLQISLLRQLVSMGPDIYPEITLLGFDDVHAEIGKREKVIKQRILTYKSQK